MGMFNWRKYILGENSLLHYIELSHMKVPQGVQKRQSQQQLLDIIGEHCLTQVVDIPTRNDKTLYLLFTNFPSPVNRVKGMPPRGKADHDIVYVEYDIKAKRIKQPSRKIYLYKRADMVGLKDHMTFENDSSDPDTPKPEKKKKFWSFVKSLKKTRLGSHHSEKTEFLRQIQTIKPIYAIGSFNQPSHPKATLTRPLKGLVLSPPWGT